MITWFYNVIDFLLPFQWVGHDFMKNALLAVILVSPIFGILGTMIVNNRMAFFSDALGHGAFTGIAIGGVLGVISPIWAAILFSIIFSALITLIKNKSKTSTDTIIGVFSSTAIALGIIVLSFKGSIAKYSAYLIGDLLSITPSEIGLLFFVFVGVLILWILIFNHLLLASVNQSIARSRGLNTLFVETLFTMAIAVIVAVSIQWVGLLIINSLLVLPAATARNVAVNVRQYHGISVLVALSSGLLGLILSYYLNTATGANIVLVSAAFFFLTFVFRGRFN